MKNVKSNILIKPLYCCYLWILGVPWILTNTDFRNQIKSKYLQLNNKECYNTWILNTIIIYKVTKVKLKKYTRIYPHGLSPVRGLFTLTLLNWKYLLITRRYTPARSVRQPLTNSACGFVLPSPHHRHHRRCRCTYSNVFKRAPLIVVENGINNYCNRVLYLKQKI